MRMLSGVTSKAMRLVKGMALFGGAVVTLALVLGAGTAALAAVPGDPFRLGEVNAIRATTSLVSEGVGGPTLVVRNENGNRNSAALGLEMEHEAMAPIQTNATGTVRNLSADALDGMDSSQFLGASAKARDSDSLDGMDSTSFYPVRTYTKSATQEGNGSPWLIFAQPVRCGAGDKLVTGGAGNLKFDPADALTYSEPSGEGWWAILRDGGQPNTLEITIRCADLPPLRP